MMKETQAKNKHPKGSARQRILEVADELFYRNGIRAIGVDMIVAQSGVAKTTLYDHFASKDALIEAYLKGRDDAFWHLVEVILANHPDSPREQLLDLFESFEAFIVRPECLGCPFLNAVAEFPEPDQPGHSIALAHQEKVQMRLTQLAQAAGVKAAPQFADQLLLLLDGAFASKRVYRTRQSPVLQLKATVQMLLQAHIASSEAWVLKSATSSS